KANDDADPNQNQTRTRERKKIREHICDQTCDQTCDQVRDQKRDQLREQKQDGSCQDEGVLKANEDVDPEQKLTRTREQKKQQDQLKKRSQIWRRIKNYLL
ncbi:MAG: hypothetical protein AMK71_09570, partial [Nitrospira bacterium SG8_35_4]